MGPCVRRDDDVGTHLRTPATHYARVVAKIYRPKEGVGNAGCSMHRGRAWWVANTRVSHHGYTGSPGIPARNGFNGFLRALPGDRALLSPSPTRIAPQSLTPASGRQDHTSLRPGFSAGKNTVKPNVYKKAATGSFRQGRIRDYPRRGRPKNRVGPGWTRLGARHIWCSRCSGLAPDTWCSLQGWLALLVWCSRPSPARSHGLVLSGSMARSFARSAWCSRVARLAHGHWCYPACWLARTRWCSLRQRLALC